MSKREKGAVRGFKKPPLWYIDSYKVCKIT